VNGSRGPARQLAMLCIQKLGEEDGKRHNLDIKLTGNISCSNPKWLVMPSRLEETDTS
jgi:hypothetical protein